MLLDRVKGQGSGLNLLIGKVPEPLEGSVRLEHHIVRRACKAADKILGILINQEDPGSRPIILYDVIQEPLVLLAERGKRTSLTRNRGCIAGKVSLHSSCYLAAVYA